jgi:hypothetical protein
MKRERYTLTYRATEAQQVMDWIKAGQSGCLIGLRGAGKSNLLRFLLRQDTQRHYLGQTRADYLFVLVDLLSLTERTEWAVYELILDRLSSHLALLETDAAVVEQIAALHQEVVRSEKPLVARRAVEQCVDVLCKQPGRHVVLIFDEFDAVFHDLDPSLFRCLRAIRDEHKDQVSYIAVMFSDLTGLRDDPSEVEHFLRLVTRNTCYLGPYGEEDSQQMVRYLASRRSAVIAEQDVSHLIDLSGGHAGLLKAALSTLWDRYRAGIVVEVRSTLGDEPAVQAECRKVWQSLAEGEQLALCALVRDEPVDANTLAHLERRGLARRSGSGQAVFSPLFAGYARLQGPPPVKGTAVRRSPRLVQIEGRRIEGLSELEFEVLCTLYERRGEVCTKQELIEHVYRQRYVVEEREMDDARLQQVVSRLRRKIESPRHIVTVRGEGYRFT